MNKAIITYLMAFSFSLLLISCSNEKIKPDVDLTIDEENTPTIESWNAKIFFTENGNLRAILYTDHLEAFDIPKEKLLKNLKVEFFNKRGSKTTQLTSERGRIDDITQDMYAYDNVVAINDSSKVRLETNELMWRKVDEKIVSDKFVRITSPDEIIEGFGLVSDQHIRNYEIKNVTYQTTNTNVK